MKTLTIELTGKDSLQALIELENKQLIKIRNESLLNSYSLPGNNISTDDFKSWIAYSESFPAITIEEAKQKWSVQKAKMLKLIT